ncbi:MAG: cytochrome C oxidase subunit IV family protein [Chitinophagaceae bacterium]|nr:cytochrome C oxidase subunit IV family protein [Chitinophagaceae bacterium]MCW5906198.1 cytochrome C oxidase subunit IV family protein [Chitinophagaceae bacterium]
MEYTTQSHGDYAAIKKEIWKVTIILSVLTIIELLLGLWIFLKPDMNHTLKLILKGTIIILMLAKSFYIVAYFMHLKHEIKNMIMTIILPLTLFIWFIIAFLYEGHSYNNLKNNYDRQYNEGTIKVNKAEYKHDAAKPATQEAAPEPAH